MIKRNTWILLAVFIVLLGAVVILQRSGQLEAQPDATEQATTTPQVMLFPDVQTVESIRSLKIESLQGEGIGFERDASGAWALTEPISDTVQAPVDSTQLDGTLGALPGLSVVSALETTLDLNVIGLEAPAYTLSLELADSNRHVLLVGSATPTGTGYYVRLDGAPPVVVNKFSVDSILELVKTPPLLPTPTPVPGTTPEAGPTTPTPEPGAPATP
jgi:hypothetical protein